MRINILQGAFFPVPAILGGAVEKVWFQMGQEFSTKGHQVTHISRAHAELPIREEINRVEHIRVRGFDSPRSLIVLKLMDFVYTSRALRRLPEADVTITNTFWAPVLLRNPALGAQVVSVQRMPKGQMRFYRRAKRWHAVSSAVSEAILREQPREAARICVIPNPLPFERGAVPTAVDAKEKLIVYAGRVHPEKGLDILINSLRDGRLSEMMKEWRVEIIGPWKIGEGGGGEAYLNELKNLSQGLPVRFLEPVYDISALAACYQRAAVFVYPSVSETGETFGVAPLEAMAFGAAPVVSDLACFRDFITAGSNGLVFNHRAPSPALELASSLVTLLGHEARRQQIGKAALAVIRSHAPDRVSDLFLRDFEILTGCPAHPVHPAGQVFLHA